MKVNNNHTVWMEKYRPQQTTDLILPPNIKVKFEQYAKNEDIPNLGLWSSSPGTGKTSTATALIKEINGEALFINASMDNGIDLLRSKITSFASTEAFDGKIKVVVLDEVDNLSQSAQFAFRSLIETFSSNCRFILTGNFKEKMLIPLLDRLENYDFNSFSKQDMVKPIFERLKFILENEKVTYDPKDLIPVINTYYPSVRSMVGALQKFSSNGQFTVSQSELDNMDEYLAVIGVIKAKDFNNMINLVNELTSPDNMYTYIYKNLKEFEPTKHPNIIMIIAKYQFQASSVRDKNLNLAACCTELMKI